MTAIVCNALEVETSTLVRVYNELSDRPVKKFTDRNTAIRRVDQLLADRGMEMFFVNDEDIQVRVAGAEVDENEDTTETTQVEAPAAAAAPVSQPSMSIRRGPTSAFLGMVVLVLVPNPKRKSSRAFQLFDTYYMTDSVDEYLESAERAGYQRRDALANLNWDIRHGFVKVAFPEATK